MDKTSLSPVSTSVRRALPHPAPDVAAALTPAPAPNQVAVTAPSHWEEAVSSPGSSISELARAQVFAHVDCISPKELAQVPLKQEAGGEPIRGATPKFISVATEGPLKGERFMSKCYAPGDITPFRSKATTALRRAAGEPAVHSVWREVESETGVVFADVTHFVRGAQPVDVDPSKWNASQVGVILANHVFNRWMRNKDGKLDQYVAIQPAGAHEPTCIAVDIDVSLDPYLVGNLAEDAVLSRYNGDFLTPAESRLWIAYVRDELKGPNGEHQEMDFAPLFDAISRVESLSRETIAQATAPLIAEAFKSHPEAERTGAHQKLVDELVTAQKALRGEFTALIETSKADREEYREFGIRSVDEAKMVVHDKLRSARHKWASMGWWKYLTKIKSKLGMP